VPAKGADLSSTRFQWLAAAADPSQQPRNNRSRLVICCVESWVMRQKIGERRMRAASLGLAMSATANFEVLPEQVLGSGSQFLRLEQCHIGVIEMELP
jgi:hypothetical protein